MDDNQQIEQLKKELEEAKKTNMELSGRIIELTDEKAEIEENLSRIKNSRAYKLSKPLRYVRSQVKRVTQYGSVSAVNQKIKSKNRLKKRYKELGTLSFPDAEERSRQENTVFASNTCISILVPLYNTPENFLHEMIDSVVSQTYKNWELCLADGSDAEHEFVSKICLEYAEKDSRIKYQKLEKNEGISGNTNECYKMATGNYIGLFDHDDVLHPSVLFKYMEAIEDGADYIYCDEATFTDGDLNKMITVHFKPDFAIDNLRANNYICHFSVFKKNLLNETALFRTEYDGSQDHDMILRLTSLAKKVVHVSGIYYYWRAHALSVAANINAKTYAIDAAKRAVGDHLKNSGIYNTGITSSRAFETIFRLRYEVVGKPLVSIIINDDNEECINAINSWNTYDNIEIIKESDYIKEKNANKFSVRNILAEKAKGDILLFLDGSVSVRSEEFVKELISIAQREDVGAAGGKLIDSKGKIAHAGVVTGIGADKAAGLIHFGYDTKFIGYMGKLCYIQDVSAVTGDVLAVRKEVFLKAGGFDESYAIAFSDIAFCLKLRRSGYLNVFNPYAEGVCDKYQMLLGANAEKMTEKEIEEYKKDLEKFREDFKAELEVTDPYYNSFLTKETLDYSIC